MLGKGNFGERSGRREERLWHKASQGRVRQVRLVVYLAGFVRVKRILKLPCRKSALTFFPSLKFEARGGVKYMGVGRGCVRDVRDK